MSGLLDFVLVPIESIDIGERYRADRETCPPAVARGRRRCPALHAGAGPPPAPPASAPAACRSACRALSSRRSAPLRFSGHTSAVAFLGVTIFGRCAPRRALRNFLLADR